MHCWCMISQGVYFCLKVQMAIGGNTDQNRVWLPGLEFVSLGPPYGRLILVFM